MSSRVGVVFRPELPPEELRGVVEACEQAGVAELWLWEDCFLEGGLTTAAAALAWSEKLHVGIGLLPVPLRNPALTAMEIASVARMFPGRFTAVLGHGVQDWMGQVGVRAESPMTLLSEQTVAIGDLLAGRTVDMDGRYVHLDGVALDWPPTTRPTLLVGARGEKTVALAGELSDGVLLDAIADADVVRRDRAIIDDAREGAGRDGRAQLTVYTEVDPTADDLSAVVAARVAELAGAGADAVVLQGSAETPDPRHLLEALAGIA